MTLNEAMKQIIKLEHLTGTKIPGTNQVIDEIIPAPTNSQFNPFLKTYLLNKKIFETAQELDVTDFEILLLSGSKKKNMFDTKVVLYHDWYKE